MAHFAVPPSPHPFSSDRTSRAGQPVAGSVSAGKRFVFAHHGCVDTGSIYIVKRISDQRMTRQGDPPVTATAAVPEFLYSAAHTVGSCVMHLLEDRQCAGLPLRVAFGDYKCRTSV